MTKFRTISWLVCIGAFLSGTAQAAITIKKAAPVASTSEESGKSTTSSLVPSLLGLVSGVSELNSKQKALTAECVPSGSDLSFINNMMKEYAKTGVNKQDIAKGLSGRYPCDYAGDCYKDDIVRGVGGTKGLKPRYNIFSGESNENMVWSGFPTASTGSVSKDGSGYCSNPSQCETLTDAYDIFNLIDFGPSDYLPAEASQAAKLLEKTEKCSTARLSAKKREMWGSFLTQTASGLGAKTNTGSIMENIGSISQSSGGGSGALGAVGSLSGIATQFMNK